MGSPRRRMTLLAVFCSGLFGCGGESPIPPARLTGPDSVVELSIRSAQELPLDAAGSSGGEASINFRWTEVLTATGGGGATVRASSTELRESKSRTVIAFTVLRSGMSVQPGGQIERPVVVTGVDSALLPGQWEVRASVDVVHPSGRVETLQAAFSFE